MLYLTAKWLHIVAVISWMAGILYLYRLLVYHAERGDDPQIHDLLSLMSRRLYKAITVPAMSVATIAGLAMAALNPSLFSQGWFHLKLLAVGFLIVSTVHAGRRARAFAAGEHTEASSKRLRLQNEIPTLLMLVIVAMVVFRPF